jgi:ribose 5-phosphate isomerase A
MSAADAEKRIAAEAAAELVSDGMTVGLGTGSTVAHLLPAIARRGLSGIRCVATSVATEEQARELGIPVEEFGGLGVRGEGFGGLVKGGGAHLREEVGGGVRGEELGGLRSRGEEVGGLERLDIAIDGTDQVTPDGWLVKGGGGAHLREKVVAAAAERFVVIADSSKPVEALSAPVPLELLAFGLASTLARLGDEVALRDVPPSPDRGAIADYGGAIGDPAALAARLEADPGVTSHGLFPADMVSEVLVGAGDGVRRTTPS